MSGLVVVPANQIGVEMLRDAARTAALRGAMRATMRAVLAAGRKRFDRGKAGKRYVAAMKKLLAGAVSAVFVAMADGGWSELQARVRQSAGVRKADGGDVLRRRAGEAFDGVADEAAAVAREQGVRVAEEAGTFALRRLGLARGEFRLADKQLAAKISARAGAAKEAGRRYRDEVFATIERNFVDLGSNPFDKAFLAQLRGDLLADAEYKAKRFALTETGIVSEMVQTETYRRNGVAGKQWNATGNNSRESHLALAKQVVRMADAFDVNGHRADHPLDPKLPAEELVNCHCWMSPVVDDDFEITPNGAWRG